MGTPNTDEQQIAEKRGGDNPNLVEVIRRMSRRLDYAEKKIAELEQATRQQQN